ncbi:MAG: LLM class F420-dependent oxidoreductase [Chloroflexi bacterium RBG_19FT_COMBO_49_13]|nr:MAG: LLM class F420-dependent oxidoreductase [Chloroflexi bacterium RBG_19FT_COMBO_49_13]
MIEVAIMIEGQNGLNWKRWQQIATTVEACGFTGLYRSDHYTNSNPPDMDSLECWVSLTWLASHTRRIEFGTLVTPVSFRHPTHTARMAAAVDDLSGGRLTLGIGAGWQEREHANYGWDLLPTRERFLRLEEGLEVITRLLRSDQPVDYLGKYYQIKDAILLPRPERSGGPPILIGGNGKKQTLPLVVRFAQEWNLLLIPPPEISALNTLLDKYLIDLGRQPHEVRRSLMTGCVFGLNKNEVQEKVKRRTNGQRTPDELRQRGLVIGTAAEIVEQCQQIAGAGIQRVMLQWLDLDDIAGLKAMADGILEKLAG